ncbi:MAG: biotin transporter BioY [Clostridiales bacterium]|nr:biotin transporter BioY [Clostridiales bacterium]
MNNKTKLITYSALMCALIVISTLWLKFSIPGTDVLVTTQVFFVILCGQILPWKYCVYTIGVYLFLGLLGLPVFSAVAGPAVIATPSFGYLLAFPFSAAAVSITRKKLPSQKSSRYIASLVGIVVNYVIALAYIAALKGLYLGSPVSMGVLLSAYCFAFLPMDVIKGILAALLGQRLEKPLRLYSMD